MTDLGKQFIEKYPDGDNPPFTSEQTTSPAYVKIKEWLGFDPNNDLRKLSAYQLYKLNEKYGANAETQQLLVMLQEYFAAKKEDSYADRIRDLINDAETQQLLVMLQEYFAAKEAVDSYADRMRDLINELHDIQHLSLTKITTFLHLQSTEIKEHVDDNSFFIGFIRIAAGVASGWGPQKAGTQLLFGAFLTFLKEAANRIDTEGSEPSTAGELNEAVKEYRRLSKDLTQKLKYASYASDKFFEGVCQNKENLLKFANQEVWPSSDDVDEMLTAIQEAYETQVWQRLLPLSAELVVDLNQDMVKKYYPTRGTRDFPYITFDQWINKNMRSIEASARTRIAAGSPVAGALLTHGNDPMGGGKIVEGYQAVPILLKFKQQDPKVQPLPVPKEIYDEIWSRIDPPHQLFYGPDSVPLTYPKDLGKKDRYEVLVWDSQGDRLTKYDELSYTKTYGTKHSDKGDPFVLLPPNLNSRLVLLECWYDNVVNGLGLTWEDGTYLTAGAKQKGTDKEKVIDLPHGRAITEISKLNYGYVIDNITFKITNADGTPEEVSVGGKHGTDKLTNIFEKNKLSGYRLIGVAGKETTKNIDSIEFIVERRSSAGPPPFKPKPR